MHVPAHLRGKLPSIGNGNKQMDHAEKQSLQAGPGGSTPKYSFLSAQLLPGQWNSQLQEHLFQSSQTCVHRGQTQPPSLKLESWRSWDTCTRKEIPVPFNLVNAPSLLWRAQPFLREDSIKAEFTTPLQNNMLDAIKFTWFCTYLDLLIFSFHSHLISVWWF